MLNRVLNLAKTSHAVIKNEGLFRFTQLAYAKIYYKLWPNKRRRIMRDVLYVAGSHLPQVKRYRVDHQVEQLRANGMTADAIFDHQLSLEDIKYYRAFVFCRYPHTDQAEDFIRTAKSFNKTVIFEIDDLIFDTDYTDNIEIVRKMSRADRDLYDAGVKRSQRTLRLCDYAVTTTQPLADELKKYKNIKDVFVNRNVASDAMVAISNKAISNINRDADVVTIGYFSGSIAHNEDFEMILPAITQLMEKYENVRLHIGGILDEKMELERFADRITTTGFVDWQQLPAEIRRCDINLAPLAQKTIFNASKSEIKWLEAALVETVTVASGFGAFNTEIEDGVTGILVEDDTQWSAKIEEMILSPEKRQQIAKNAHNEAEMHRTTISSGGIFARWLQQKLAKNVAFVIPSSEISGGVNVVLQHADILRRHGYDVTIINYVAEKMHTSQSRKLHGYNEVLAFKTVVEQLFDEMVATLWATVPYVRSLPNIKTKTYFVQSFETSFLHHGDKNRLIANSTYCYDDIKYTTMSLWCKRWLKEDYGRSALYASNGLWGERYNYTKRDFSGRKVKILIEGDPHSRLKNTDEAFRIANQLDKNRFEVNFLSYYAKPKDWYVVDNFHQKVPSEEVGKIYEQNDILLKTSLLESFSYPPLEMIATGGFAVVIPNDGNKEYLVDGENCLMFQSGDDGKAIECIETIVSDAKLRDKLGNNGRSLAERYDWSSVEGQILELYE